MKKKREQLKGFSQVIQHQWTKLLFCICNSKRLLKKLYWNWECFTVGHLWRNKNFLSTWGSIFCIKFVEIFHINRQQNVLAWRLLWGMSFHYMRGTQLPQRGMSQDLFLGRCSDTTALAWNVAKNRLIARMIVPPALWCNTHTQLLLCSNVHHHALKAQASPVLWVDVRRQDHVNILIPLTWPNIPSLVTAAYLAMQCGNSWGLCEKAYKQWTDDLTSKTTSYFFRSMDE